MQHLVPPHNQLLKSPPRLCGRRCHPRLHTPAAAVCTACRDGAAGGEKAAETALGPGCGRAVDAGSVQTDSVTLRVGAPAPPPETATGNSVHSLCTPAPQRKGRRHGGSGSQPHPRPAAVGKTGGRRTNAQTSATPHSRTQRTAVPHRGWNKV